MLPSGTSSSKSRQTVDHYILDITGKKTTLAAIQVEDLLRGLITHSPSFLGGAKVA
jgi:hypothetical protein